MAQLLDCPSCGGLIPSDRRCCPHCHCKTPAWRRWLLLASAALGLGTAGCDSHTTFVSHYGGAMVGRVPDLGVPDLGGGPNSGNDDGGQ